MCKIPHQINHQFKSSSYFKIQNLFDWCSKCSKKGKLFAQVTVKSNLNSFYLSSWCLFCILQKLQNWLHNFVMSFKNRQVYIDVFFNSSLLTKDCFICISSFHCINDCITFQQKRFSMSLNFYVGSNKEYGRPSGSWLSNEHTVDQRQFHLKKY